jgi:glucose/mannose-6-phosphate isomerase
VSAFSPGILDDPTALAAGDRAGLLRALASAGAQVAPDANAPYLSSLLASLGSQQAPFVDWREPMLPRWAGPADALVVVSADGRHPRLAELVEQADRRGLALAVAAPAGSPVAAAAPRHPVADVSYLASVPPRAVWWALATPALLALDVLGLAPVGVMLAQVADALDEVAETNRPDSSAFTGPAKLLAAELAQSVPVIAGAGSGATVAARRIAGAVQLIAGSTAMAASLPDDVARVGSLLEFSSTEADLFADRVSDVVGTPPRLVLIGDDEPYIHSEPSRWDSLGGDAARRAGSALAELASRRGIGCSRVQVPDAPPLVRFAAAAATGDFAATYLALARGIDPSAPRLGELPH